MKQGVCWAGRHDCMAAQAWEPRTGRRGARAVRVTAAVLLGELQGGEKAGTRPAEAEGSASKGLRDVRARQHHGSPRSRAAPRPPRDGGAEPGSESMLQVPAPGSCHLLARHTRLRGADGAPRESRKEGTSGRTRKRHCGGQGPHAPDPLLCGQAAEMKPCPRSAVSAGAVLLRGHTRGDC